MMRDTSFPFDKADAQPVQTYELITGTHVIISYREKLYCSTSTTMPFMFRRKKRDSTTTTKRPSVARCRSSYLEKIGGEVALELCVEIFCERVVSDQNLMKFFRGVNVARFKEHQLKFMRIALTAETPPSEQAALDVPCYRNYIVQSHCRFFEMGLNESHFDRVMVLFSETCKDLQVKDKTIEEVYMNVLLPYRDIFVNQETSITKAHLLSTS